MIKTETHFVAQRQPHNDEVEVLYTCTSYDQAADECDRINSYLADFGIPSLYYAYIV